MKYIKRQFPTTQAFNLNESPDGNLVTVDVLTEWGTIISTDWPTNQISGSNFSTSLDPFQTANCGVMKLNWKYQVSGIDRVQSSYFRVYNQYIDDLTFFNLHPELEDANGDNFAELEIKVQNVMNTYCGQQFEFRPNEALTFDGSGKRSLYLTRRLDVLTQVILIERSLNPPTLQVTETDVTVDFEIDPTSNRFIRTIDANVEFGKWDQFKVTGNWGWPYVPQNVTDASELILQDWMDDDSNYRKHNITEAWFDRERMVFNGNAVNSTGNLDADVLLMDYTIMVFDWI